MTTNPAGRTPGPAAAPPTTPEALDLEQGRSSWPTVIGVIAVILAAGGILIAVWRLLGPLITGASGAKAPPQELRHWASFSQALSVGLSVLLLVAGVELLRRHRWGVSLARAWSIAYMILLVVFSPLTYKLALLEAAKQVQKTSGMTPKVIAEFGIGTSICFGCVVPVFLLIWFSRRKIRSEVATWS
jgi:hypothetical protein